MSDEPTSYDRNQDRRLNRIERFVITPDEAPPTPDAGPTGEHQRLRIFVPNTRTDLTMGYRATPEQVRSGWPNYDGFGVTTEGSICLDAHNSEAPEQSKIQLQATGKVCVQSEKNSILMSAKEESLFHSGKYAYLHGNKGVVIAGGVVGIEPKLVDKEGKPVPRDFEWLSAEKAALYSLKSFWSNVHNFHTCVEIAEIVHHVYHHRRTLPAKAIMWNGIHTASEYVGAGWLGQGPPIVGGVAGYPTADIPLKGATYIHGSEYIVMGGGLSTAIFGGLGAQMASLGFVGLMGSAVAATAAVDLQMQSFHNATVFGKNQLELVSNKEVMVASRSQAVTVTGKHVRVGGNPEPGHHQAATEAIQVAGGAVSIGGREHVQMESDKNLHIKSKDRLGLFAKGNAVLAAPKTWVVGRKEAGVLGRNKAIMRTDKFGMWVTKDEIKLATVAKMPPPPDEKDTWVYEGLAKEGTELTISNAKKFVEEKWSEWTAKAQKIGAQETSVTLKKGNIKLVVNNYRVTLDGSKAKMGSALVVKL